MVVKIVVKALLVMATAAFVAWGAVLGFIGLVMLTSSAEKNAHVIILEMSSLLDILMVPVFFIWFVRPKLASQLAFIQLGLQMFSAVFTIAVPYLLEASSGGHLMNGIGGTISSIFNLRRMALTALQIGIFPALFLWAANLTSGRRRVEQAPRA